MRRLWIPAAAFTLVLATFVVCVLLYLPDSDPRVAPFIGVSFALLLALVALNREALVRAFRRLVDLIRAWCTGRSARLGLRRIIRTREQLRGKRFDEVWAAGRGTRRIDVSGHTLSEAFASNRPTDDEHRKTNVRRLVAEGCVIRALILDHSDPHDQQVTQIGRDVRLPEGTGNYLDKLRQTVDGVQQLRQAIRKDRQEATAKGHAPPAGRLVLKRTSSILHESILRADDEMLVTFYTSSDPEGDGAPTMDISGPRSFLFHRYANCFSTLWQSAILHGARDQMKARIRLYRSDAAALWRALHRGERLPPPRMAILFPTYACTRGGCHYCMYRNLRDRLRGDRLSLPFPALSAAMDSLYQMGVRSFEISGGGEPSDYDDFPTLVAKAVTMTDLPDVARFGLITNGARLLDHGSTVDSVVSHFAYVRFSLTERAENMASDDFRRLDNTIHDVARRKRQLNGRATIGLKALLRPGNADALLQVLERLIDPLGGIAHFRIRAARDVVDSDEVDTFEDRLANIIEERQCADRVSLDLQRTVYHRNATCWVSPLQVVVAPEAVYACVNYAFDMDQRRICAPNDIGTAWGSASHVELIRNLATRRCANDDYCNCRLFSYQAEFEKFGLDREAPETRKPELDIDFFI